jgi:hypothetical protein
MVTPLPLLRDEQHAAPAGARCGVAGIGHVKLQFLPNPRLGV